MKKQRSMYNNRKWWQMIVLLLLAFTMLAVRAWGFKDRVLGLEEGERYLALCALAGEEKNLWVYRLRELTWIACSMLAGASLTWWVLGIWGAGATICLLGICPNQWWIFALVIAFTLAFAWMRTLTFWEKVCPKLLPITAMGLSVIFAALTLIGALRDVKINQQNWAKMTETLDLLERVEGDLLLYNQPRYKDFLEYYLRNEKNLVWHEEVNLSTIEKEYAYMICEEGLWFADRDIKEYGITYADLGSLWFAGLEDSMHLVQVQWGKYSAQVRSEDAVKRIKSGAMDGVLLAMYPMNNFKAEYFDVFLGSKMENVESLMTTGRQLVGAVEYILSNTESLQTVYIGMEQGKMGAEDNWTQLVEAMQKYPQIHFQVLLASPTLDTLLKQEGQREWESSLTNAVTKLDSVSNAELAYVGNVDWLFLNQGNFAKDGGYTDRLAKNLAANALMSKLYPIDKESLEDNIKLQMELVESYKEGKYDFEKGQGKTILFMGDSIFGYTQGSASIPGVVESLFGAKTYNLGFGGLTASTDEERGTGAYELLQETLTGDIKTSAFIDNQDLYEQMKAVQEEGLLECAGQGENLIFVLNFGLNDYYNEKALGTLEDKDTNSYLGAMKKVISTLKETYPKGTILVLMQNLVVEYNYGTEKRGTEEKTLEDFRKGILSLAEQMGICCLDVNEELELTKENLDVFLVDGTHPNFYGNFCYGYAIAQKLEEILQ